MPNTHSERLSPAPRPATRYEVAPRELDAIMGLLRRLLDIRITFFDMQEQELGYFHIKAMSGYCARRRASRAFNARCVACDRSHLDEAKRIRDALIYHCHNGLIEGIVPLYDQHGIYLGAIVFGQLRDPERPAPADASPGQRRLYQALQTCTPERAHDIGYLLKYVSEYIIEKELIRYRNRPWAEQIERFIGENPGRRITVRELADLIGASASFITHHFRAEFGRSPKDYVWRAKMEKARALIEGGKRVQDVAEALGFYDAFHFSKRFKAYWGQPPSRFLPTATGAAPPRRAGAGR